MRGILMRGWRLVIITGNLYWLYLSIKLSSFLMFALWIIGIGGAFYTSTEYEDLRTKDIFMIFLYMLMGYIGLWFLIFGTPNWILEFFA